MWDASIFLQPARMLDELLFRPNEDANVRAIKFGADVARR